MSRKHGEVVLWLGVVVILCIAQGVQGAEWPQFLGPERDNVAHDAKGLARSWPEGGPEVLWTQSLGIGFGGPAIYGDSVLLLDREEDARDVLRRIRLADGEETWRFSYDAPGKLDTNGSRTTPATDGDLVFTIGPFGHVHAVKFSDGSKVWQAHLLNDWGARRPGWGVTSSPLLLDDKVIVAPWGSKAALVAYDKADGKVVWETANPAGTVQDYSSPVLMKLAGRTMIVATGKNGAHTIGVDAETGKQLWLYNGYNCSIHIPSPIVFEDGRVLLTGGYGAGSAMFRVAAQENGFKVTELWASKAFGSTIGQAVIHDGHIYLNKGFKSSAFGMTCATLDGQVKWETGQNPAFDMGPILLADGLIFVMHGATGELVIIEPDPSGYTELARARLLAGNMIWAPIAHKDGKLVLRDQQKLVCVDVKG